MNHKLEQIYRQIPKSSCPPGCGECCGILFPSLAELRNIQDWCIEHHIEYKGFNYDLNVNCPYLMADKRCQIYPVRPFLCRIFGITDVQHLRCKKCQPINGTLPRIQADHLYRQVYLQGKEKSQTEKHKRELNEMMKKLGIKL